MKGSAQRKEEQATAEPTRRFILFIAEGEPNSIVAQRNLEAILSELDGPHDLQISDVFTEFELAATHNILVTPCLLMLQPEPAVMVVGTLKDKDRVRNGLRFPEH